MYVVYLLSKLRAQMKRPCFLSFYYRHADPPSWSLVILQNRFFEEQLGYYECDEISRIMQ